MHSSIRYRAGSNSRVVGNSSLTLGESCLPRLSSSDRQPCNRIDMNARAVDQREFGSLFVEGQREIGTAKDDRLRALVPEQTVARGIEDRTLILSHKARRGHRNICLMHIVQVR